MAELEGLEQPESTMACETTPALVPTDDDDLMAHHDSGALGLISVQANQGEFLAQLNSAAAATMPFLYQSRPTFLTIPTEIRIQIYVLFFQGNEVIVRPDEQPHTNAVPCALANILSVCQTCHLEASPIFLATVRFKFKLRIAIDMLPVRIGLVQFSSIRHISIDAKDFKSNDLDLLRTFPAIETMVIITLGARWPWGRSIKEQLAIKERLAISGPSSADAEMVLSNHYKPACLHDEKAIWIRKLVSEVARVAPGRVVDLLLKMRLESWRPSEAKIPPVRLRHPRWEDIYEVIETANGEIDVQGRVFRVRTKDDAQEITQMPLVVSSK